MRQEEFEQRYAEKWQNFELQIQLAKASWRKRNQNKEQLANFAEDYRAMCYLLSLARERQYSPHLIQRLDVLVFDGHQILYQKRLGVFRHILKFILVGFPQTVRKQSKFVWIALLLFYLPALLIFTLTLTFPELVYSVVDAETVSQIESMYDPTLESLGRDRQSDTDLMMFGHYIQHNISIAFQCFAGGILAGLGTLFYLIFNGSFFGAIGSHIVNIGFEETFYSFVIGHSSFELTGIVLSGAAGLQLGWSVIAPGNFSRRKALSNAGRSSMLLVYGAVLLLLVAAFIEAFWSSSSSISPNVKYWVGGCSWILLLFYLVFVGRGRVDTNE